MTNVLGFIILFIWFIIEWKALCAIKHNYTLFDEESQDSFRQISTMIGEKSFETILLRIDIVVSIIFTAFEIFAFTVAQTFVPMLLTPTSITFFTITIIFKFIHTLRMQKMFRRAYRICYKNFCKYCNRAYEKNYRNTLEHTAYRVFMFIFAATSFATFCMTNIF